MKKMLFCAAAAIAALASCSKTQVVYNDAPEEIAFKQITGAMTKATTSFSLDQHHTSMGVFANVKGTNAEYFGNTSFSKTTATGESYWVANPTKYWPFQTELQFIVYAPYLSSNVSVSYSQTNTTTDESGNTTTSTTNIPTLEIKDFTISDYTENRTYIAPAAATESTTATLERLNVDDLMYGDQLYVAGNQSNAVAVNLKHALARVEVNVQASVANAITIESIVLEDVIKTASLSVPYSDDPDTEATDLMGSPAWDEPSNSVNNTIDLIIGTANAAISTANSSTQYGNPFLVIPGDQTKFTITYTLNEKESTAEVTLDEGTIWEAGKKYIYDFTFTLNEIKLSPTVTDWVEGDLSGTSTDENITVE